MEEETKEEHLEEEQKVEQQNIQRARWTLASEQIARIHHQSKKYEDEGILKNYYKFNV